MERDERDFVAIIGMAGCFPGAADVAALWTLLREGREGVSRLQPDELDVDAEIAARPDFVPAGGTLADFKSFDPAFFGMTREEAEQLDPQHRVALECAWLALEDAGLDPLDQKDGPVSVILGAGTNTYGLARLLRQRALNVRTFQTLLGLDRDYLASRIAYKLGLCGPALAVSSACSTGLLAVALAAEQLLDYTCDLAIAGGVFVAVPHHTGYLYEPSGIFSPDGHCRPFDAASGGTVPSSGAGVVVLKRLPDARRDGDPIRAVLSGFAINNDGDAKVGYTAPGVRGQAAVIAAAQAMAQVQPAEIPFIEAHGTATQLGDAVEIAALKKVFGSLPANSVFLGAVKSNLGHLNAAAGVAGLIKAVLAVEQGEIPPTLHFASSNPHLALRDSPFCVPQVLTPWPVGRPRRAGVSSFGFGGTNVHLIVEAEPVRADAQVPEPSPHLLLLSGRTPTALAAARERLATWLEQNTPTLSPVARTLHRGRAAFAHRIAVVAATAQEAIERLRAPTSRFRVEGQAAPRKVVFLCTGQGAVTLGVGQALYEHHPIFAERLNRYAGWLAPQLGQDLRALLYPVAPDEAARLRLIRTELAQPLLLAVTLATAAALAEAGVRPDIVVGHSVGELAAAVLAGALPEQDALQFAVARGAAMAALPGGADRGGMLAVAASTAELEPLPDEVEVAVVNGPQALVLGGPRDSLAPLAKQLTERGIRVRWLATSHAFHTRSMEPALGTILEAARKMRCKAPQIPLMANVTGSFHPAERTIPAAYWAEHARQPVRFDRCLANLYRSEKGLALIELGPGRALADLANIHPDRPPGLVVTHALPAFDSGESADRGLLRALGQLFCAGVPLERNLRATGGAGPRVGLPGTVFDRIRCWDPGEAFSSPPAASKTPAGRTSSWPATALDMNRFVDVLDES